MLMSRPDVSKAESPGTGYCFVHSFQCVSDYEYSHSAKLSNAIVWTSGRMTTQSCSSTELSDLRAPRKHSKYDINSFLCIWYVFSSGQILIVSAGLFEMLILWHSTSWSTRYTRKTSTKT
ncbi:hypothetical protein CC78DRAFT_534955 [Lojkania enalia]|uniref:Uncharacterized protein n=1 Tax=Lojkania enalia TaxID=147567 RepID=A0A9P4K5P2_9PLEO|nr:hypothetical protein CC78DRAFT_534955 [Didymosphaeria enalia]